MSFSGNVGRVVNHFPAPFTSDQLTGREKISVGDITMTFKGGVGNVNFSHENKKDGFTTDSMDQAKKDTHVNMIFNGRVGTVINNVPR